MAIILRPVLLILLTQASSLRSFEIVHSSASKEVKEIPGPVTVLTIVQSYSVGDTVELVCEADSSWEYCSWTRGAATCRMEWKRAQVRAAVAGTRVTPRAAAAGRVHGGHARPGGARGWPGSHVCRVSAC